MELNRREFLASSTAAVGLTALGGASPAFAARDEFAALDGMAQADLVRTRQVSALELVDAAIARIEKFNPKLNAVVAPRFESAREEAKNALFGDGPFSGVPYLIKDLSALKGEPLTYGSRLFAKNVAKKDDGDVIRAKEAGFVMVAKSNTPEFGLLPSTESLLYGPSRNPWDLNRHSGGSSGGAAAAVAAGLVPCANAGDGGGSIRIPASICGLVGLKPSRHRLFGQPDMPVPIKLTTRMGVSRSVRDTAQLLNIAEFKDDAGAFKPVGFVEGPAARRLKIAYYTHPGLGEDADPAVKAQLERTAALCTELGHEVVEARPQVDAAELGRHFLAIWSSGVVRIVKNARLIGLSQFRWIGARDGLEPWTIGLAEYFETRSKEDPDHLEKAVAYFRALENTYNDFFAEYDVILTPVLRKPPAKIGDFAPDLPFDDLLARQFEYAVYTGHYNGIGNCAISLPLGWTDNALPIGSQFAAKAGDERTLLELSYELEQARPWAARWPGYSAVS